MRRGNWLDPIRCSAKMDFPPARWPQSPRVMASCSSDQIMALITSDCGAQEETIREIVASGKFGGMSYPRLAESLVDAQGQLLTRPNDIVSALAAQQIGGEATLQVRHRHRHCLPIVFSLPFCRKTVPFPAALQQLRVLEANLWVDIGQCTTERMHDRVENLLRLDRVAALFFNLELRYRALVRMIIEHMASTIESGEMPLPVFDGESSGETVEEHDVQMALGGADDSSPHMPAAVEVEVCSK